MTPSFDRSRIAILVVEDEPMLLWDAIDMIEEAGFTAYGAANADEAIRLLKRHSNIRVLFTDVDMPGSMDGLKLAHAVCESHPPISIILASGHIRISKDQLPKGGQFFSKPYPPASIVNALNKIAERIAN